MDGNRYAISVPPHDHPPALSRRIISLINRCVSNYSQSERVELRRQTGLGSFVGQPQGAALVPARLVPQLASIALTDQHSPPLEQRELAQFRRQQQSSMPVEVQFGGVSHHEPLQSTRLRV